MATPSIKEEARKLVEKLPENSTWEDLVHEIYVRQAVEAGLADSQAGRTTDVEQVRSQYATTHISPTLCYNSLHGQTTEGHMEYPIVLEQDPEAGGYVVTCPTLKGCVSQGETEEEALENIKDAIRTYLESIEDLKRLKKLRTVEVGA
jgi:predicted RNase H-like HicB family nuclease